MQTMQELITKPKFNQVPKASIGGSSIPLSKTCFRTPVFMAFFKFTPNITQIETLKSLNRNTGMLQVEA